MQNFLLLFRLSLLTVMLVVSEVGGVAAQTMAWANGQTYAEQPSAVQTRFAPINLRQLLNQLETTYRVQFNYKASVVSGVMVSSPAVADYEGHIADQLNELLSPARLRCRAIDTHTFVIQPQASPRQSDLDARESTPKGRSLPSIGRAESPLQNDFMPDRVLSGRVTDGSTSEGLPGVSVVVKGTTRGTITDINGAYSINVPNDSTVLVF